MATAVTCHSFQCRQNLECKAQEQRSQKPITKVRQ